ncbi:hypothetical protein CP157_03795 (plasmid) [Paracoccus marcusii]|nr:hypothetical protein CP157_03795 [Paracoccus marcusii]
MDGQPTFSDKRGELEAIHPARHIHIGEDDTDIRARFQDPDCIRSVSGLNRFETRIFNHVECGHPEDRFIFHNQNQLAFQRSILGHQVFPSQGCCICDSGASIEASSPVWL